MGFHNDFSYDLRITQSTHFCGFQRLHQVRSKGQ